jgi:hypothetical protein
MVGELPSDPGGSTKGDDERVADTHRLPAPVTDIWDWQVRGACRGMDRALFFHPENERGPARANRETAPSRSAAAVRFSLGAVRTRRPPTSPTAYRAACRSPSAAKSSVLRIALCGS